MALAKAQNTDAPEFEEMPGAEAASAPAQSVAQPAAASTPNPAQARSNVPAVAKSNLPANASPFKLALLDKQEVLTIPDIEAIGFGTFPRITADLGGLVMDDVEIGKVVKVEIMSWNIRYMATTNSQDQEAKKLVRTSYDNETISGTGESLHAYIDALKAQGYDKSSIKVYGDIWGNLVFTEKEGDIPQDKQQMVQVQLSPQSLQQFKRLQMEQGIRESRGGTPMTTVTITGERAEFNGNRFGKMLFAAA